MSEALVVASGETEAIVVRESHSTGTCCGSESKDAVNVIVSDDEVLSGREVGTCCRNEVRAQSQLLLV